MICRVATAFGNNLNYEQQLAYRLKALEIKRNILDDPNHFDLAKSYLNIALAYKDLNDKENLVNYFKQAISVYEKRFNDEEDLNTDLARCNLALGITTTFLYIYSWLNLFIWKEIKVKNQTVSEKL